jgi:hypothetical protein
MLAQEHADASAAVAASFKSAYRVLAALLQNAPADTSR